jgi:hypothetical protein
MAETLMEKVASLAEADGATPINQFPGVWERRLDEHWLIAANGHRQPVRWAPKASMYVDVPPFHVAVLYHGWVWGVFNAFDGCVGAGVGEQAGNVENFIAAIDRAIESKQKTTGAR